MNKPNEQYFEKLGQTPWGNLNGTVRTFAEMDHAYISNVYWHLRLRDKYDKTPDLFLALQLNDYITDKFGHVAPYRPWTEAEVDQLVARGNVSGDDKLIRLFNGMVIGHTDWRELESTPAEENKYEPMYRWPY
jgi:hypothetical protein